MKRRLLFLALSTSIASAAVPHAIQSGKPAIAQDVNENFVALDTAIQNRATKSDLGAKSDSAFVAKLLKGKADTASLAGLNRKADTAAVRKSLSDSISALRSATLPSTGGSINVTGALAFQSGLIQFYPGSTAGALYADNAGAPGPANYSFAWVRDGSASYMRAAVKYFGVRAAENAPVYSPDGVTDYAVWHAGNLPSPISYGGNRGATAFTDNNPPIGSWQADPGSAATPSAPNGSYNIQVFSTGNAGRGLQIAGPYDSDNLYFRRGEVAWKPWVQIAHSGNVKSMIADAGVLFNNGGTISGDLRISGKLVTNPGATPADYVFEPDYKLASLSDVEAYTKENKHLPEIPSAADMTSKGVDLAAMNMALLKKVEELTLHAIAQQKEIDAQKHRIDALESKITGR